jgi:hypothetical protein
MMTTMSDLDLNSYRYEMVHREVFDELVKRVEDKESEPRWHPFVRIQYSGDQNFGTLVIIFASKTKSEIILDVIDTAEKLRSEYLLQKYNSQN